MKRKITPLIDLDQSLDVKEQLHISLSRRGMFSALSEGLEARKRAQDGLPAYQIESLPRLEAGQLGAIRPHIVSGCTISLKDGFVWASSAAVTEPLALFTLDSPALFIFNQFNGEQTIAQICRKLVTEKSWAEEDAMACVRGMFFALCEKRICAPENIKSGDQA